MKLRVLLVSFASVLVGLTGCKTDSRPAEASRAGEAPVNSDRQGAEQAIRASEARWREIVARKDTAAIRTFFTNDAVYLPQDRPPARGREAVARMWATGEFSLEGMSLERTPIRIEVAQSGDIATEIGTWVFRAKRQGKPFEGRGSYMSAWRKDNGEWKASAYIWNTGSNRVQ